jgi:hypothetical protein
MLGVITSPVLTNITVLAQTSSERSVISQSSADDAIRKRNDVRSIRKNEISVPPTNDSVIKDTMNAEEFIQEGAGAYYGGADYIEKTTTSYRKTKSPIGCRLRATRTVLGWKCPRIR